MTLKSAINKTLNFVTFRPVTLTIFFVAGALAPMLKFFYSNTNNWDIFRTSSRLLLAREDLYAAHPEHYLDYFLYGPIFAVMMFPFAFFPKALGLFLFLAASTALFVYAIYSLDLPEKAKASMALLCSFDFLTNQQIPQTNGIVAALVILSLAGVQKERILLATFCIALGAFMKVYGIVALVLFLFTDQKLKFALYFVGWCVVLYYLPALFSSVSFVNQSYVSWIHRLGAENEMNTAIVSGAGYQSLFDFLRRNFGLVLPVLPTLAVAGLLTLVPLAKWKNWKSPQFACLVIAFALISIVIFSTGTESPTYLILQVGAALWFITTYRSQPRIAWTLMTLTVLFCSLAPTDLYPRSIRDTYAIYVWRIIPGLLLWIRIYYEMLTVTASGAPKEESETATA
jgi:hypothetical protein